MSVRSRMLGCGLRWSYDKTLRGQRLRSSWIYLTRKAAIEAEAQAAHVYVTEGRVMVPPPPGETPPSESVFSLYARWVRWLKLHRAANYASKMQSLMARAVAVAPEFAGMPADSLTEDQVEQWGEIWAADLVERGHGLQTVNDWLRYSATAFNEPWGRKRARRLKAANPFEFVDRYSVEHRAKYVPTPQEVAAIRLAADGEFRLYVEIVAETAARVGEARALAWEDVILPGARPTVVLYTRKTATGDRLPRRVGIQPELVSAFKAWRRAQGPGRVYVFQQEEKEAAHHDIWVRKNLAAACQRAKVPYFPPGCFRHYRASKWADDGKSLTWIQTMLGHSKATTTDVYLHALGAYV
ncbi:MAG: tyrosine-type recombinase/integrase [Desulfarculaceae bacterium]|nr:tyrosine-type recombinase/integrase [Desulfarculaceae bacterium]